MCYHMEVYVFVPRNKQTKAVADHWSQLSVSKEFSELTGDLLSYSVSLLIRFYLIVNRLAGQDFFFYLYTLPGTIGTYCHCCKCFRFSPFKSRTQDWMDLPPYTKHMRMHFWLYGLFLTWQKNSDANKWSPLMHIV